jgi:hypothetical protein
MAPFEFHLEQKSVFLGVPEVPIKCIKKTGLPKVVHGRGTVPTVVQGRGTVDFWHSQTFKSSKTEA